VRGDNSCGWGQDCVTREEEGCEHGCNYHARRRGNEGAWAGQGNMKTGVLGSHLVTFLRSPVYRPILICWWRVLGGWRTRDALRGVSMYRWEGRKGRKYVRRSVKMVSECGGMESDVNYFLRSKR
jgi:hypothetical protein